MSKELANLTKEVLGLADDPVLEPLPMAGSDRFYWRVLLPDGSRRVLAKHEGQRAENFQFAPIARFLEKEGVRVPRIYAEKDDERALWLEDLGDDSLESIASRNDENTLLCAYKAAVEELARLHTMAENAREAISPHLQAPFDAKLYTWEQEYFFTHLVGRHSGLEAAQISSMQTHPALGMMAWSLAALPRTLVHRDCQSQNILLQADGRAALIDFQGMRLGLPEYDLAALLYDPYVEFNEAQREEIWQHYHSARGSDADEKRGLLRACAIQRLMQALGAYANLSDNAGKTWYRKFIPVAMARLKEVSTGHPVGEVLRLLFEC